MTNFPSKIPSMSLHRTLKIPFPSVSLPCNIYGKFYTTLMPVVWCHGAALGILTEWECKDSLEDSALWTTIKLWMPKHCRQRSFPNCADHGMTFYCTSSSTWDMNVSCWSSVNLSKCLPCGHFQFPGNPAHSVKLQLLSLVPFFTGQKVLKLSFMEAWNLHGFSQSSKKWRYSPIRPPQILNATLLFQTVDFFWGFFILWIHYLPLLAHFFIFVRRSLDLTFLVFVPLHSRYILQTRSVPEYAVFRIQFELHTSSIYLWRW